MSDLRKISEARQATRKAAQLEWRQAIATEDAADSLEGIRQDLTIMAAHMTTLIQGLSQLTQQVTVLATRR